MHRLWEGRDALRHESVAGGLKFGGEFCGLGRPPGSVVPRDVLVAVWHADLGFAGQCLENFLVHGVVVVQRSIWASVFAFHGLGSGGCCSDCSTESVADTSVGFFCGVRHLGWWWDVMHMVYGWGKFVWVGSGEKEREEKKKKIRKIKFLYKETCNITSVTTH